MGIIEFILLLIVAAVCGGIAQSLVGGSRGGCLASIALGFIGALLGTWIAGKLGLPELISLQFGEHPFPIVWSIIGTSLFVAVLSLFSRRREY